MRVLALGLSALAAVAALPAAACGAAPSGFQRSFDYDRTIPLAGTSALQSETDVARIEKVTFKGADGQTVPALLMLPKGAKRPFPCVFAGHPLTSNKDEVFAEKVDGYAAQRVGLFAIDARYHGERAGIGPEQAVAKLDTLEKLFRLTVIDMRRGLDYLAGRKVCDPARTGYEGRSLGGFMGSMLIGADKRIKAAALYVSGADWRKYFSNSGVFLGGPLRGSKLSQAVKKMAPIDPLYWIPRAKGRAVFMAAGRRDESTPFVSAQALQSAAKQPKQVLNYNGGHDIEDPFGTQVFAASAKFLKRYLRF